MVLEGRGDRSHGLGAGDSGHLDAVLSRQYNGIKTDTVHLPYSNTKTFLFRNVQDVCIAWASCISLMGFPCGFHRR